MTEQTPTTSAIADAFTLFGSWTSRGVDISLDTLLTTLGKHNVSAAATIKTTGIFSDFELGNHETIEAAAANPLLIPIATLDPRRHLGWEDALRRARRQGCWLFALFPETQGWSADSHSLGNLANAILDSGAALLIEAGQQGSPSRTAASLAAGAADKMVILTGVNYRNLGESLSVMERSPGICLCTHSLASVGGIEIACEHVGAGRVFFSSSIPLTYFSSPYLRLRYSALSDEDKNAVLGGNLLSLRQRYGKAANANG